MCAGVLCLQHGESGYVCCVYWVLHVCVVQYGAWVTLDLFQECLLDYEPSLRLRTRQFNRIIKKRDSDYPSMVNTCPWIPCPQKKG